jgi:hypothetical protein
MSLVWRCAGFALVGLASVQAFQTGGFCRLPSARRGQGCVLSLRMCDDARKEASASPKKATEQSGWWNQLTRALFPSAEERRKAEVAMRRRGERRRSIKSINVQSQVRTCDVMSSCTCCMCM